MKTSLRSVWIRFTATVGTLAAMCLLLSRASAQPGPEGLTVIHSIAPEDMASGMLVEGPDGALYGTMPYGGEFGAGAMFRLSRDGNDYTILHSFSWDDGGGSEVQGVTYNRFDGFFYGIGMTGGEFGFGTLFRLKPDGSQFEVLHQFTGGADNGNPVAALTQVGDRAFCGITASWDPRGTVFRLEQNAGTGSWSVTTIHRFEADIGCPGPPLVLSRDGALFGVTYEGEVFWGGTVFRLNPDGSDFAVIHDFSNDGDLYTTPPVPGLAEGNDGALYGLTGGDGTAGSIFKLSFNPATSIWDFQTLFIFSDDQGNPDWIFGTNPFAGMVVGPDGALYGTTSRGGDAGAAEYGAGTVFKLSPQDSVIELVHTFTGGEDGSFPLGAGPLVLLSASGGLIYGTTGGGGANGMGTIFGFQAASSDTTPPHIAGVTASPSILWPANKKIVPVSIQVTATDDTDPAPVSVIKQVTSNESTKPGDIVIDSENLVVHLRAARSAKTSRVYTITVGCTDTFGNESTASVDVTVPHDMRARK